jgi:hypothetical protein
MKSTILRLAAVAAVVCAAWMRVAGAAGVPDFTHVYVIVMENHEYSDIIGNGSAPYINSLVKQYAIGAAYTAVAHPSLPNYMSLTGGATAFSDDCIGCVVNTPNIADQIEASGRRWKAYMEDMPAPCTADDSGAGLYTVHHNPFVHYTDIVSNTARCQTHVLPLASLGTDLAANTVPDFAFITPNLCDDMHDCTIAAGDAWLQKVIPAIVGTRDFNTSVLFLVWDEGTSSAGGGGRVPMLVISPMAKAGFQSTVAENHYSLLRTIEAAWGLPMLGQSAQATPMFEYFGVAAAVPGAPSSLVASSSGSSITLSWHAPTSGGAPTSYLLEVGSAPGLSDLAVASTGSLATTLTAPNAPTGTFYIRIRAQNSAGTSAPSNEAVLAVGVPGPPTSLVGTTSGTSLTLTWHAPTIGGVPTTYVLEGGSAPGLADLGSAALNSLAMTLTLPGIPPGTYYLRIRARNSLGTGAASNEIAATIASTPAVTRNPATWPFSPDSIWNMPIGSGAVYKPTGLGPATELFGDVDIFVALKATDPARPLINDEANWSGPRCGSVQSTGISLNVPATLIVPDVGGSNTPNNAAAFLLPDGHTLEQVNALARCLSTGPVYGIPSELNGGVVEDLYGSGITGGHAGSNLSSIGGTIRLGELTASGPIRHALKIDVDGSYLDGAVAGGFRWPANTADSCAPGCYTGTTPDMRMGALLAVPPGATEQSLNLTTVPGKKLFHALQDYGGYVVDDSADPSYNLAVESGVKQEFKSFYGFDFDTASSSPWFNDFHAVFSSLQVVSNNGPATIGGGGAPRAALAPPVAGPTVPAMTASLSVDHTTITAGGSAVLSWSVGAGTVSIDQGIGSVARTGTRTVSPHSTTTYTLSASTSAGAVSRTVTIVVN